MTNFSLHRRRLRPQIKAVCRILVDFFLFYLFEDLLPKLQKAHIARHLILPKKSVEEWIDLHFVLG